MRCEVRTFSMSKAPGLTGRKWEMQPLGAEQRLQIVCRGWEYIRCRDTEKRDRATAAIWVVTP